ncbi:MAG: N-formylglutamate deformylase [Xanthomonadales bacterium]|nr:N-formylglutamate deformylase [Xanthomonadales bacterium]
MLPGGTDTGFELTRGSAPLLISVPHDGRQIPDNIRDSMTPAGRSIPDTDWDVARLYRPALGLGAGMLVARWSRYVVDLNRNPDGSALYPGASETGVCPTSTFARAPIYQDGREPGSDQIEERVQSYWQPYHDALERELQRLRNRHGYALLWDAHSIRSRVPRFFQGELPDYNLGTADGASCPAPVTEALAAVVPASRSVVINGRFKGGHITRHYGRPAKRVLAVQLELSQSTYLDPADPQHWNGERAAQARDVITRMLSTYLRSGGDWMRSGA